jgi:hypothetical protein
VLNGEDQPFDLSQPPSKSNRRLLRPIRRRLDKWVTSRWPLDRWPDFDGQIDAWDEPGIYFDMDARSEFSSECDHRRHVLGGSQPVRMRHDDRRRSLPGSDPDRATAYDQVTLRVPDTIKAAPGHG